MRDGCPAAHRESERLRRTDACGFREGRPCACAPAHAQRNLERTAGAHEQGFGPPTIAARVSELEPLFIIAEREHSLR